MKKVIIYSYMFLEKLFLLDIDECNDDALLCRGGSCINKEGSFSCSCPDGHELMPDGKACKGNYCRNVYSTSLGNE